MLQSFFNKRTPPGVQNSQPGLFQQMPGQPSQGGTMGAMQPAQPKSGMFSQGGMFGKAVAPLMQPPSTSSPGQQRQQGFNQEQRRMNTGMIGGRNNRRGY